MSNKKKISGQQIIETLLLFAAVIVVLILFLGPTGSFRNAIRSTINVVIGQIHR